MRWLYGVRGAIWALLTCLLGLPGSRKGAAASGGELFRSPRRLCACVRAEGALQSCQEVTAFTCY